MLRSILAAATELGAETTLASTMPKEFRGDRVIRAEMRFRLGPPLRDIMAQLSDIPGVVSVELANRPDDL